MLDETGDIKLGKSPGRPRIARTKANILKVKQKLNRKKKSQQENWIKIQFQCSQNITR